MNPGRITETESLETDVAVIGGGGTVRVGRTDGLEIKLPAGSALIATGGYSANKKLVKKYYPAYSENMVFLGAPNTGDGLLMAEEIGAATEGLGVFLFHPHY